MKKPAAFDRRVEQREIDHQTLLAVLKENLLLPEAATKIVATGHRPEALTVTVSFDA